MCPPTHFAVSYVINPWMDPAQPVNRDLAISQWESLRDTYRAHGYEVETITPAVGLPDMVYAANSALVLDGTALMARFRHVERRGEVPLYDEWFRSHGLRVRWARAVHEGEGDFAVAGDVILGGTGFRTSTEAHDEVAEVFGRPVVSLQLVDPRFYHLDTALTVLNDDDHRSGDGAHIMYYPAAFSSDSQAELRRRYPDAIVASEQDAHAFGLNAFSDGQRVFLPAQAERLAKLLDDSGYQPVPVDLSELRRGGGSVKCCTLELRP